MTNDDSQREEDNAEPTKIVRVPASLVDQVERFVRQNGVGCPFFESRVQAGFPSPAEGEYCGPLDIVARLIPHPENVRLVRVPDESMKNAGIYPDDILIADRSLRPRDGDIVVVNVFDEILIRRLVISGKKIEFHTENDENGENIPMSLHQDGIEILGVVRHSVHTLYGPKFFD